MRDGCGNLPVFATLPLGYLRVLLDFTDILRGLGAFKAGLFDLLHLKNSIKINGYQIIP